MKYYLSTHFSSFPLTAFIIMIIEVANCQPIIESHSVEVTYNKTSSIIFPAVIKSVDKGSRDILAQKAKGVENVLQLKAARENFPETNVTVITADGILHQFKVNYASQPTCLSVDLTKASIEISPLIFQSDMTESDMETYSAKIILAKKPLKPIRKRKDKISLSLNGIYIKENVIFYHFRIRNHSNINYDVDFLRFFIRDQANMKRTASQEVDVKPLYVYGNDKSIHGHGTQDIVYALQKFTIPEAKHLVIEMFEKNGGRNLNLRIKNGTIVNAKLIE